MAKNKEEKIPELSDLDGVGPVTLQKFKELGINLAALAARKPREISDITGIPEPACVQMHISAREKLKMDSFKSGDEVAKEQDNRLYLTTGSNAIDSILGGGLAAQWITEAYGKFGSGKTQLAHQLCITAQLPLDKKGLGEDTIIIFLDSENTFSVRRIRSMAKGKNMDPDKVLKNIRHAYCHSTDDQILMSEKIEELLVKEKLPIKLIICDSLTANFRAEYVGRENLGVRQARLNGFLKHMHRLAKQYDLIVYITNQVYSNPAMMFGDPIEAFGGNITGHSSSSRIYLRPGKKGSRVAKLVDSPDRPDAECIFYVDEGGLKDG